ncbi:MAG: zinc-binding dehydrogenase, partial [Bacteroidetes bacterium SB0668_bin_1]|nr:zinc-binding dehydrogenase [Bacteroidetes bacterium SB0668_bin_1]
SHWGGYAEVQRVDAAKLLPLPEGMSLEKAMLAGTAGLTAMLSVMELEAHGVGPGKGEVLVTGASGGVGSFAVGLLHEAGYRVAASTGSPDAHDWLGRFGADRIIEREALAAGAARPLDSGEWAGAVDVVGGKTLEALLSRLKRHGTAVACGLAGGHALHTTVFPFILRGVRLIGVDTNTCPVPVRRQAWAQLARWMTDDLVEHLLADTIGLGDLPSYSQRLLAGEIRGRLLVDVRK